MPLIKNRYAHRKVYRPRGTRFSSARGADLLEAVAQARENFHEEFGEDPEQRYTVIECIGVTGDWVVDFFEVKD